MSLFDIFGAIKDFLEKLWSFVVDFWDNVATYFRNVGEDVWDYIWSDVDWLMDQLYGKIEDVGAVISGPLEDVWDQLMSIDDTLFSQLSDVSTWISSIPEDLGSFITDLGTDITQGLSPVLDDIWYQISGAISDAQQAVSPIFEDISERIWGIGEDISESVNSSIGWLQEELATSLPDISSAITGVPGMITSGIRELAQGFFKTIASTLEIVLPQAGELIPGHTPGWVEDFLRTLETPFRGLADVLYSSILAKLEYEPPATEAKVKEAIKAYLATVFEISLGSHLTALIADNIKYVDKLGLQDILRSIFFNLGLNWLTWVVFAEPFRAIITDPMNEIYREKYRTNRATKSEILEAWRMGALTEPELADRLAKMGYPDEDIEIIELAALKPASEGEIEEAYRRGLIDRETYHEYLRRLGYMDWAIDLKEDLVWRDVSPSTLAEAWQRGFISYEEFLDRLEAYGYSADAAQLYALTRSEDLSPSMIVRLYLRGLITYEEAITRLMSKGYSKSAAEDYLALYSEDETSEERKLTKSEVLRLFTLGLINRDEAKSMLIDLGYSPDSAEYLVSLQEAKEESAIRELRIKAIMDDFRDGVISEEEARKRLLDIGVSPARIDALIEYNRARKERPPPLRRPSKADILRAYKAGIIDIDTADAMLEELGYRDAYDRALLLALYAPGFPEEPTGEEVVVYERE